mgnify:CR=1 FL=1|jgi:hypothetical protein
MSKVNRFILGTDRVNKHGVGQPALANVDLNAEPNNSFTQFWSLPLGYFVILFLFLFSCSIPHFITCLVHIL